MLANVIINIGCRIFLNIVGLWSWLEHSLPEVAPTHSGAVSGAWETHIPDHFGHQLLLVPIDAMTSETEEFLSVGHLDPPPKELDAVQVWTIWSVPDHLNAELRSRGYCWGFVDTGVVPKDGQLPVLAHSQPQLLQEAVDVRSLECASQPVELDVAAAPLADACKDRDVGLVTPALWELLRLSHR